MKKDVLYIDVEDDVTAIIDRLKKSDGSIIALVLPKRAQVLHSSVNMRLIKRAGEESKKRLVLVTNEAPVLRLAGTVGLYVSKSLTSKPALIKTTESKADDAPIEVNEPEGTEPSDPPIDKSESIGKLAKNTSASAAETVDDFEQTDDSLSDETIDLSDIVDEPEDSADMATDTTKSKKNRKLRVPNFEKFRLKLFIFGSLLTGAMVLGFFAFSVWPAAQVTIKAQTSELNSRFEFTAKTDQKAPDLATKIIPAMLQELKQNPTEKITATGKKDLGTKASGTMTVYNCNKSDQAVTVPAGSGFTNNGMTFRTSDAVTVAASNFKGDGTCKKDISKDVAVTADQGGDIYNLSARSYAADIADVSGFGSAMTGGTSKIVTVVSDDDIEAAKQKIIARPTDDLKAQLIAQVKKANLIPLEATFTATPGSATGAPKSGDEATETTVTLPMSYQMIGVKQTDVEVLVDAAQKTQFKPTTQKIFEKGITSAKYGQLARPSAGEVKVSYTGVGTVGPLLDAGVIAQSIAGKSGGETKQIIMARPGIDSVDVQYSPFWVLKTPKKLSKITIIFDVKGKL